MRVTKKDYYEILAVSRDVDEKKLKAAYRRLARKYHPDVNKGDRSAEKKFKQVSEAFAVLSDPQKRARYDRGGHEAFGAGFDPFAGFDVRAAGLGDLADLFGGMFGGLGFGAGGQGTQTASGNDLKLIEIKTEDKLHFSQIRTLPRLASIVPSVEVLVVDRQG